MQLSSQTKNKIIFVLGVLSAIGPLSIDMYLPAFKNIAEVLHTTQVEVGYTLSSFFFGICLGQLINGPMFDQFGRKKVLYIGLGIYVIASLGSAISQTVNQLIILRFFQAIGASVGMVAPNAVVRETFEEEDRPKVLSLLILILGVSPILAPTIGSIILSVFNWPFIFIVLAIIMFTMIFLIKAWLPENTNQTKEGEKENFSLKNVGNGYLNAFREKKFLGFAMAGAIGAGSIFAFVTGAPLTFLSYFHLNEQQFGWVFAIIASGIISASQLNTLLLKRRTSFQIVSFALPAQFLVGSLMVVGAYMDFLNMYSLIFLLFIMLAFQGLIFPNMATIALKPIEKNAGSASALMGALQMAIGSLSASFVSLLFTGDSTAMALIMCGSTGIATIIFFYNRRYQM
jgi:DHA1 family bicyclomycin/chloramphenicol resistance-like MFS transporter